MVWRRYHITQCLIDDPDALCDISNAKEIAKRYMHLSNSPLAYQISEEERSDFQQYKTRVYDDISFFESPAFRKARKLKQAEMVEWRDITAKAVYSVTMDYLKAVENDWTILENAKAKLGSIPSNYTPVSEQRNPSLVESQHDDPQLADDPQLVESQSSYSTGNTPDIELSKAIVSDHLQTATNTITETSGKAQEETLITESQFAAVQRAITGTGTEPNPEADQETMITESQYAAVTRAIAGVDVNQLTTVEKDLEVAPLVRKIYVFKAYCFTGCRNTLRNRLTGSTASYWQRNVPKCGRIHCFDT